MRSGQWAKGVALVGLIAAFLPLAGCDVGPAQSVVSSGLDELSKHVEPVDVDALKARVDALDLPIRMPWQPPEIVLEHDMEDSGALAAAALAQRVSNRRFPAATAADCAAHAGRFTWLAARADDPEVQEASLQAMIGCRGSLHQPDAIAVAAGRMQHSDDVGVLGAALDLAFPWADEVAVESPLIDGLVRAAIEPKHMGVRIEALEVLDERVWSQETRVSVAFYEAMMAEWKPSLTATSLRCLTYRGAGLTAADRWRFLTGAMVLASDIDPGIRGMAALALARIDPDDEDVRARVLSLLDDKHPYTRSAAAEALADMGYLPAVHELVARLDDQEPNLWRMLSFTRPDGRKDRLRFRGSHFERVDDAMLRALERVTADLDEPFVYRDVHLLYKDLDIISATRDARRWYEEFGSQLPRRGEEAVVADASPDDAAPGSGVADEAAIGHGEPPEARDGLPASEASEASEAPAAPDMHEEHEEEGTR